MEVSHVQVRGLVEKCLNLNANSQKIKWLLICVQFCSPRIRAWTYKFVTEIWNHKGEDDDPVGLGATRGSLERYSLRFERTGKTTF